MTLLREIQLLLERTYGPTGINLEKFLLDTDRSQSLFLMAGATAAQIADLGRVFLRIVDGKLYMGIFYNPRVIEALECNNPQCGLNDGNILPFMVFLEEIDHAVHAALKFKEGERDIYNESFIRDLELQAKIDTYLILQKFCVFFNEPKKLTTQDRRWLLSSTFDTDAGMYEDPVVGERYYESNQLGRKYVRYLDRLTNAKRTTEIRQFRRLTYGGKKRRIAALTKRACIKKS